MADVPQIDLGLGYEAELDSDEIILTDEVTQEVIELSLEQFDRLVAFVAEHRSSQ